MHTARRVLVLPLVALVLAGALAPGRAAAGQPQRPIVREIVVQGFPGDPAAILDLLQTEEGAPLDLATLDDDLERLLRAGHLATFRIQERPDGVRLILTLSRTPTIRKVTVTGAGGSWDRKLRQELVSRPGSVLSPVTLRQPEEQRFLGDKERLRTWCQERGYRDVAITTDIEQVTAVGEDADQVDVTFHVTLGPKYQVKWLRFEGNEALSTRELKRRMQTKKDTFLTSRRYCDRLFEEDIQALQDYYRYKGYPDATVTYRRVFRGKDGSRVDITIVVDEGKRYPTGAVDIQGCQAVSAETLRALIPLRPEEPYSDELLMQSVQKIERRYQELGYPDIQVVPTRQLNDAGAYDVDLTIEEGRKVVIHTVRTEGHPRTKRQVILRELELQPGDTYDVRKLEASQRALDRLQFFDSVVMDLQPTDPPTPGERDLHVKVEEGRTGVFRFGVGYSTINAVVGTIDLTQYNFDWRDWPKSWQDLASGNAFVGAGQFFRISLMPGFIYSNYLVQYNNPYWKEPSGERFLGMEVGPQSFGWAVYYRTRDQGEWDERRIGLRLERGLRKFLGDPDTDLIFHTRLESVGVLDVDEDDAPKAADDEEGTHFVGGLGATLKRDRTDRRILPTTGTKWETGIEGVVPEGVKLGAEATRYWTLGGRGRPGHERVFSLEGRMDYAITDFPIYERFFLGPPLLRGFEYRGAGPHDNDEPEGGDYRAILSAQYRHPLVAKTLYTVLFLDAGTVTEDFTLFGDPRLAAGVGFRLVLPKLSRAPISLDFGVPLVKESDDDTQVIYFSISLDR